MKFRSQGSHISNIFQYLVGSVRNQYFNIFPILAGILGNSPIPYLPRGETIFLESLKHMGYLWDMALAISSSVTHCELRSAPTLATQTHNRPTHKVPSPHRGYVPRRKWLTQLSYGDSNKCAHSEHVMGAHGHGCNGASCETQPYATPANSRLARPPSSKSATTLQLNGMRHTCVVTPTPLPPHITPVRNSESTKWSMPHRG